MTTPIDWTDILETGVDSLDREHRDLVEQANALTTLLDGVTPDWPAVVTAAGTLATSCREHFRAEEALLEQTEFPRREQHGRQHRAIEQRFDELLRLLSAVDGSREGDRAAARTMRETIIDILFRHDLDYKSHLQFTLGH